MAACKVCLKSGDMADDLLCKACESFAQKMAAAQTGRRPGAPEWNHWFIRTLESIAAEGSPLKRRDGDRGSRVPPHAAGPTATAERKGST